MDHSTPDRTVRRHYGTLVARLCGGIRGQAWPFFRLESGWDFSRAGDCVNRRIYGQRNCVGHPQRALAGKYGDAAWATACSFGMGGLLPESRPSTKARPRNVSLHIDPME